MQLIVQAICSPGKSLREAIAKNDRLEDDSLKVSEQKRSDRPRGWTKIHSTQPSRNGAINVEWDAATNILVSRVVTRGRSKPNPIVGDFTNYLLRRYGSRIQTINIIPRH